MRTSSVFSTSSSSEAAPLPSISPPPPRPSPRPKGSPRDAVSRIHSLTVRIRSTTFLRPLNSVDGKMIAIACSESSAAIGGSV